MDSLADTYGTKDYSSNL